MKQGVYYLSSPNLSDEYIFDSFVKFSGTVIDCIRAGPPQRNQVLLHLQYERITSILDFSEGVNITPVIPVTWILY